MRIGTITFHCAYNFGSALQAYALKEYLTNLGHDVHIIDYRSDDFRQYRIFRRYGFKSTIADLFFCLEICVGGLVFNCSGANISI